MRAQENRTSGVFNLGLAMAVMSAQMLPLPLPALLGGAVAAQAQPNTQSRNWNQNNRVQQITCQASGNRTKTCNLPDNVQSIRFIGPDRSGVCREGQTWQQRGKQLRVSGGCGGTFEVVSRVSGNNNGWGNSGWGNNSNNNGWGNGNQGFAGELTCRSNNNREQECKATTQNRVVLLQQISNSACVEGQSWRHTNNKIIVRNGCQGRFGYGYGNVGGNDWNNGNNGWNNNSGFAGNIECRSENNRQKRCNVNTNNRVEMVRQFSNASCTQGRSWGYDRNSIWVNNGCQARFAYGYGNEKADTGGNGPSTGAIIGGAALAAGLVALLATSGKGKKEGSGGTAKSATLNADLTRFPQAARQSGEACLKEAARQVGETGGSAVRLDSVDRAERSGEGWLILARLSGTYANGSQAMSMDCRATGTQVTGFDIR